MLQELRAKQSQQNNQTGKDTVEEKKNQSEQNDKSFFEERQMYRPRQNQNEPLQQNKHSNYSNFCDALNYQYTHFDRYSQGDLPQQQEQTGKDTFEENKNQNMQSKQVDELNQKMYLSRLNQSEDTINSSIFGRDLNQKEYLQQNENRKLCNQSDYHTSRTQLEDFSSSQRESTSSSDFSSNTCGTGSTRPRTVTSDSTMPVSDSQVRP